MKIKERFKFNTDLNGKGIRTIYGFCIALMPLLCILEVPVLHIGFGTVIVILFTPYALYYIINGAAKGSRVSFIPFLFFYLFLLVRSLDSVNAVILSVATLLNLWGMLHGSADSRQIRRIIEVCSLLFTALVMLQTACHYVLHINLTLIPESFVIDEYRGSYVFCPVAAGLYRPSAIFMEPAHFAQYCCFGLISTLFPTEGRANMRRALFISAGVILTTSGMGIALTAGILAWYIVFNREKHSRKKYEGIVKWSCLFIAVALILLQIPFFQIAIQRVFSNVDGYNAVQGRTAQWKEALGSMPPKDLLLGYGSTAKYPYYLSGIFDTVYKFGIVGLALELWCFAHLMSRKVNNYVWCGVVCFLLLFCVAHLINYYTQLFYFGIVIADAIGKDGTEAVRHKIGRYIV